MAYALEFPKDCRIHNVFHVSRLKKVMGQHVVPCAELTPLDDVGQLAFELEIILDTREKSLRTRVVREFLVKWKGLPKEDATWESEGNMKLLEEKQIFERGRL